MEDTDTLLALLSSLLEPQTCDTSILLEALVKYDGDVEKAARYLSQPQEEGKRQAQKRKRTARLDDWLDASPLKASPSGTRNRDASKPPSKRVSVATSPSKNNKLNVPAPSSSKQSSSSLHRGSSESTSDTTVSQFASPSKVKPVSNSEFMTLLRPPISKDSAKQLPPKFPPLTLSTPMLVSEHTPCTLHPSVLPPELACRLFYAMMNESQKWQRNKWWLFDRVVESPHRTSFYARQLNTDTSGLQEAAQYWYNGRPTAPPSAFPPAMEEACEIVERMVNREMRKRKRFPLEWGGTPDMDDFSEETIIWRANVAAANCYEGAKESVGFHSDQLTNLGPYPTIASLSLGTSRIFRLREVIPTNEKDERSARTYNIPLQHNSLLIMHASTQEMFKHSVPPQSTIDLFHPSFPPPPSLSLSDDAVGKAVASNARINITFRFYRHDFRAELTPRCHCGVPCILRPDMKNRYTDVDAGTSAGGEPTAKPTSTNDIVAKYWWTCYAGAQNEGKGCKFWKVMDVKAERRGPFAREPTG